MFQHNLMVRLWSVLMLFVCPVFLFAAEITLKGKVTDAANKDPLIGCSVSIKGTSWGTLTDVNGEFNLKATVSDPKNVVLVFSYIGYTNMEVAVTDLTKSIDVALVLEAIQMGDEVVISASRMGERITESPVSIQKINTTQIRNSASGNFYQSIGNLKEIDILTSSLGFQSINTRGFNTTAPVRMVQFIDGIDNQAPGLNLPVGNLVGALDIDLDNIEIISGASSALYGANAFQGVISMTSKSPFDYPGFQMKLKGGTRALFDGQARWANTVGKNKKFGYKITAGYMRAKDWVADDPELNKYGDVTTKLDISGIIRSLENSDDPEIASDFRKLNALLDFFPVALPGQIEVTAPGYMEKDLADPTTESLKLGAGLFYRFKPDLELSYNYKFGRGTAIYQLTNRYSINNITFHQHKLELTGKQFMVKAYTTMENAGDSYDMVFGAINISKAGFANFAKEYIREYVQGLRDRTNDFDNDPRQWMVIESKAIAYDVAYANAWLQPGSPEFDSAWSAIKKDPDFVTGALFLDKSSIQHVEGQYNFDWKPLDMIVGAAFRNYHPRSYGTIFRDTLINLADTLSDGRDNPNGEYVNLNTWDVGAYTQLSTSFFKDQLRFIASFRVDKAMNYATQFSPRGSVIFNRNRHTLRLTAQSAFRSPTLQNQYILLDLGAIILKDNLNGDTNAYDRQSVLDFQEYYDSTFVIDPTLLVPITLDPLKPEQVKSVEFGYRGVAFNKFYFDFNTWYSVYNNFIGDLRFYQPDGGARAGEESGVDAILSKAYRVVQKPVNAKQKVKSYGASIGMSYYIWKSLAATANYTWTDLNTSDLTDPIIPGFNTPNHKFNIGLSANKIWKGFGFNINFKWVDSYQWDSPFAEGVVPSFNMLDALVSYEFPKYFTLQVGGSNITNNKHIEAIGSPTVGGMFYTGILFDLERKQ
jgi:iron complex outermembrane recepter protein